MIEARSVSILRVFRWTGFHIFWLLFGASIIASLYYFEWMSFRIPWVPISVIGTAVAFYAGFKNNSAYDRLWEARKIWGGIVNSSRAWGMYVDGYVSNLFAEGKKGEEDIHKVKQRLIYRHLGWLYTLRSQLLKPAPWEHISQSGPIGRLAQIYQERSGIGLVTEELAGIDLDSLIPAEEYQALKSSVNAATQIINAQSRDLAKLREENYIDDFRHVSMERILYDFYEHQGKCERIKKFPLPRQYANMSRVFIGIFIILLPFSIIPEMSDLGSWGLWLGVPTTALIGWVYVVMELVGDYSENPFSGMTNDIPMLSLCRTIEIDMRQMLHETDLPAPIQSKNGVLM